MRTARAGTPVPIAKPSALDRKVARWQKQTVRDKEKQARKRQADRKWRALSALVCQRDKGVCRVCGHPTTRPGGHPALIGQAHHIVYRSAGGKDDLSNLVWLCATCHDEEHRHLLVITGTADKLTAQIKVTA